MPRENIDDHATLKHKKQWKIVLFINFKLRKYYFGKAMSRNASWECHRNMWNQVTKLKAISGKSYFEKRINIKALKNTPSNYWQTIKPSMTNKIKTSGENISQFDDNRVVRNRVNVGNIFNNIFIRAASNVKLEASMLYRAMKILISLGCTKIMMVSSNVIIFRVTGPLWGESPDHRFSLICAWTNCWANNGDAGDSRRHRAHYDVTVISFYIVADKEVTTFPMIWRGSLFICLWLPSCVQCPGFKHDFVISAIHDAQLLKNHKPK